MIVPVIEQIKCKILLYDVSRICNGGLEEGDNSLTRIVQISETSNCRRKWACKAVNMEQYILATTHAYGASDMYELKNFEAQTSVYLRVNGFIQE